jgi:hypothetical protein
MQPQPAAAPASRPIWTPGTKIILLVILYVLALVGCYCGYNNKLFDTQFQALFVVLALVIFAQIVALVP